MRILSITFLAMVLLVLGACQKEDPQIDNEEEVITTLTYTLTPTTGGTPVVFSFRDLDGDGGNAPVIVEGTLQANSSYLGAVTLLNETESPAEDITTEIMAEDEEHQLFYVSTVGNLDIRYNDADANNNPIGLKTTVITGSADQGTLKIILRHEPNKTAGGVSINNPSAAGGETDIEVTFNVAIQ